MGIQVRDGNRISSALARSDLKLHNGIHELLMSDRSFCPGKSFIKKWFLYLFLVSLVNWCTTEGYFFGVTLQSWEDGRNSESGLTASFCLSRSEKLCFLQWMRPQSCFFPLKKKSKYKFLNGWIAFIHSIIAIDYLTLTPKILYFSNVCILTYALKTFWESAEDLVW